MSTAFAAMLIIAVCISQFGEDQGPAPLQPMPSGVPTRPTYPDADAIVAKLGEEGLPCTVLSRGTSGNRSVGESLTCESKLRGLRFHNEIHSYNLANISRARIGNAIAIRLQPPYNQTIVVAGNWFVRVVGRHFAFGHHVAKALGGAVLRPGPPSPTASFP